MTAGHKESLLALQQLEGNGVVCTTGAIASQAQLPTAAARADLRKLQKEGLIRCSPTSSRELVWRSNGPRND